MSKLKSAVALILITILILGVGFMCFVSFSYGVDQMKTFNSVVSMLDKDARLGGMLADGKNYLGGGYTAVYYPEGVISSKEYDDNLKGYTEAVNDHPGDADKQNDLDEFVAAYERYPDENGPIYFEKETVYGKDGTTVSEEYKARFAAVVDLLEARLEGVRDENTRVDVRDDYTVQISVPAYTGAQGVIVNYFGYTGAFGMGYGSDASSATRLTLGEEETVGDYVKGVSSISNGSTAYIAIDFTDRGRDVIAGWTASAADSSTTLFFYVGDEAVISLSVNETINQNTLYVSGSYTEASAEVVALTLDSALRVETDLSLTLGELLRTHASFGDAALILMYVSFGVIFVGMMVLFFLRYGKLAFAHLYTALSWVLIMILLVWGIPFLHLGLETYLAFLVGLAILSVADAVTYERVRREYAAGKTMISSVKSGYKRCFWAIFDTHVALALFAFITYAIALTELGVFAFTLGLGVVLSCLGSLFESRFCWAALMSFADNKGAFCKFKREETEDD